MVGVLSALVAVLVGWQIYTLIDMRKFVRRLEDVESRMNARMDARIEEVRFQANCDTIDLSTIISHSMVQEDTLSLSMLFSDYQQMGDNSKQLAFIYLVNRMITALQIAPPREAEDNLVSILNGIGLDLAVWENFYQRFVDYCKNNADTNKERSLVRLRRLLLNTMLLLSQRPSPDNKIPV